MMIYLDEDLTRRIRAFAETRRPGQVYAVTLDGSAYPKGLGDWFVTVYGQELTVIDLFLLTEVPGGIE